MFREKTLLENSRPVQGVTHHLQTAFLSPCTDRQYSIENKGYKDATAKCYKAVMSKGNSSFPFSVFQYYNRGQDI